MIVAHLFVIEVPRTVGLVETGVELPHGRFSGIPGPLNDVSCRCPEGFKGEAQEIEGEI